MDDQDFHTAALVFAHYIGIDLDTEPELIKFAEDALDDLPPDWELGIGEGDNKGIPYYFNTKTDKSVWVHPLESKYRRIVEDERKKLNQRRQSRSNINKDGNNHNMDRGRDMGNNRNANKRPEHDITEIEDFDEEPVELEKPKNVNKANTLEKKDAVSERPKFGMASDDFFDNEPEVPRDYSRLGSRSDSVKIQENNDKLSPNSKAGADKPEYKPIFSKNWLDDDNSKGDRQNADRSKGLTSDRDRDRDVASRESRGTVGGETSSASAPTPMLEKGVSFAANAVDSSDRDKNRQQSGYNNYSRQGAADREDDKYRRSDHDGDRGRSRDRDRDKTRDKSYDKSKDGDRDWDRDRDRSPGSSRLLEDENRKLKSEIATLIDDLEREKRKVSDLTAEKETALDRLRRDMNRVDADLAVKTAEVRRLQEEVDSCDSRAKRQADVAVEDAHIKHRESIKLLKMELEDEWRARLDTAKKRSQEEIQDIRREVDETKRRLEETADEAEAMRRKVINSREDGRGEASVVLEACRTQLRETEDKLRLQGMELKRVKEDHASLSMKASGAMQSAHVSIAESEAVKAQATSAIAEAHSSQAALMLATQRLQQAESETSKVRAENIMLKREVETMSQELKKYQAQTFIASDGVSAAESEARRSKARLQAEINRLTTRCSELSGLNSALQSEVDMAAETQNQAVREVIQQLSKAEGEQHICMIRLHDADERNERTLAAVAKSDAELRASRELVQKKERAIRDLNMQKDELIVQLEDERSRAQVDSDANRKEIKDLRAKVLDGERALRDIKETMQDEMAKKIPEIAANAAAEAEKLCGREADYKLSALRSDYEMKLEQKTRELIRAQTGYEESTARLKVSHADEKAEVERLRAQTRRLQRRCDELEADAEDRRRQTTMSQYSMGGATPVHYIMPHQRPTPVAYPAPQASFRYTHGGPSESIDGTMHTSSVGLGTSHMHPDGSYMFPPPPPRPNPSQSIDVNATYTSVDEQKFVEMMQNEIKGIQEQLSRSTINMGGATPAPRWVPNYGSYIGGDSGPNQTMSYAASPASAQMHYQGQNSLSVTELDKTDRSRDEGRAWAELLAKQAKREGKQMDRAVGFTASPKHDENLHRGGKHSNNYHRHHSDDQVSSGPDLRKSSRSTPRGSASPQTTGGRVSRGSTPVKASGGDYAPIKSKTENYSEEDSDPQGYSTGYWKTKYMR